MEIDKLKEWLNITPQQFELLKIILALRTEKIPASPKNIEKEYFEKSKVRLQKPNLFTALKKLLDANLITKVGQADYSVNISGIKSAIIESKQNLSSKLDQVDALAGNLDNIFRRYAENEAMVGVNFLEYDSFDKKMLNYIKIAKNYYTFSRFPGITYSPKLLKLLGRNVETLLIERAINLKDLNVHYLTGFDIIKPFQHALKVYHTINKAKQECLDILNRLDGIITNNENIRIHYLKNISGLDMIIPEASNPENLFITVRGNNVDPVGVIHVESRETTRRAKDIFLSLFEASEHVNESNKKKILADLNNDLNRVYRGFKNGTIN
jgi:hypothetical protein